MSAATPFTETEALRQRLRQVLGRYADHAIEKRQSFTEKSLSPASLSDVVLTLLVRSQALEDDRTHLRLLLHFAPTLEQTTPLNLLDQHLIVALSNDELTPDQFVTIASTRLRILTQLGDRESAKNVLAEGRKVAEGHPHLITELYIREGVLAVSFGDYAAADRAYQQGLALAQARQDETQVSTIYNNQGNVAYARDLYEEASAHYQKAWQYAEPLPDPIYRIRAAGGMAMTLDELERYSEAEKYHDIAKDLAETSGNLLSLLNIELNLSYHWILQHQYTNAIAPAARALPLARQLGDWDREAFALHNLGQACLGSGDLEAACSHLSQALERRLLLGKPLYIQITVQILEQLLNTLNGDDSLAPALRAHLLLQCQEALEAAHKAQPPD